MNTFKKNGGFTLVELIIVIAILAILSSGAVAGYSTYIKKANTSAVETELSHISSAAVLANAMAGNVTEIEVEFEDDTMTITISAASFADKFATEFTAVTGATEVEATEDGTLKFTLDTNANWEASDYEDGSATWTNNAWN